jgi:hypothetical protein
MKDPNSGGNDMSFKEDLEKLIKDATPGDSISVAIVSSEADKLDCERAGVDLVVVGKQSRGK